MIENNFFPCLRILDPTKADLYHINMVFDESIVDSIPVITFVDENREGEQSIKDLDKHGLTGSELVKSAFSNLRSIDIEWSHLNDNGCNLLVVDNQRYASEKILDKDFLKGSADQLNTKEIVVGVPVQGAILCCPANDSKSIEMLKEKLMSLYNDFSRSQISKLIFFIKDGIIEKNELAVVEKKQIEPLNDFPEAYSHDIAKIDLFSEIFMIKAIVGAENIDDLLNGMFANIHNTILKYNRNKDFNGAIEFQSIPDQPVKNMAHVNAIRDFMKRLKDNPTISKVAAKYKEPISISFLFGKDFQKGDVHKKIKINLT